MRGLKKIQKIVGAVMFGSSVGLLVFLGFVYLLESNGSTSLTLRGVNAYVVMSGSMEPNIKTGSLVITKSLPTQAGSPSYSIGDVITFKTKGGNLVTHRIVDISPIGDSGGVQYFTKGDANEERDYSAVPHSSVVGEATHSIPYAGYAASFAKTPRGFVALVIIPSSIIIWEELKVLFGESRKGIIRIDSRLRGNDTGGKRRWGMSKLAFVIPGVASLLLVVAVSSAALTDIETSVGNVLAVYAPTPTPSPTGTPAPQIGEIVINEVYYDPDGEHIQGNLSETEFEWVELLNVGGGTVNLKDWKIVDNSGFDRSISTSNRNLDAGEYVVLAKAANVRAVWGFSQDKFIPIGENFGNGLANSGDKVILKDSDGTTVDQISYGSDDDILDPSIPDVVEGHSIERFPAGTDTDTAADFIDQSVPTPSL